MSTPEKQIEVLLHNFEKEFVEHFYDIKILWSLWKQTFDYRIVF